jgi:PKD repeat protein
MGSAELGGITFPLEVYVMRRLFILLIITILTSGCTSSDPATGPYATDPTLLDFTCSARNGFSPGEPVEFTDRSMIGLLMIVEYRWDFGDGSDPVYTTDRTVTHEYAEPGIYYVTDTIRASFDTFYRITKPLGIEELK